jgi:hypothetical protein
MASSLHERGCLFCLRHDGGFSAREHIFGEALGNREYVLPPGIVCDRCNHGPLSAADNALADFGAITMRRTHFRIPGKRGTVPVARWRNATLSHPAPGHLVVVETSPGAAHTATGPNTFRLQFQSASPLRPKKIAKIARAIWKTTLEFVHVDEGPDEAFDPKYDEVRAMVCGQTPAHGVLLLARQVEPSTTTVSVNYDRTVGDDGRERVVVNANYFGVHFATELLVRELSDDPGNVLPRVANVFHF